MRDNNQPTAPLFLQTLKAQQSSHTPVWFMRQAGRYLPEYRKVREQAGSFLDLCYNPELASEVTVQPIRRYGMDAAILFADILLIPHALGQKVWFVAGEGPRLDPPISSENIDQFRKQNNASVLDPVYETVRLTRAALSLDKALIGFAGAPWTVATYMLTGGPSKDPSALRSHYYQDPGFVDALLNLLVDLTVDYLIHQINAGADAIQLFDTWAGGLPEDLVYRFSLGPMEKVAKAIKQACPEIPVIFFPKGVGPAAEAFAKSKVCDGIGIDTSMPADWACKHLAPHAAVQGGLDPLLVVQGGVPMEEAARHYLKIFKDVPHIFNLGHGFVPETSPEHVSRLMDVIRAGV